MRSSVVVAAAWITVGCRGGDTDDGRAPIAEPAEVAKAPTKSAPPPVETPPLADPATKLDVPAPPKPAAEPGALVLHAGKLVRLSADGTTTPIVDAPGFAECEVDDHHRVVWLASTTAMSAYDPDDGTVHPVVTGVAPPSDTESVWRVQLPATGGWAEPVAGTADGLSNCVALVLTVGPTSSVGGEIVGEGDREVYCYDGEDPFDEATRKLTAQEAAAKKGYDAAKLVGAKYLALLHARARKVGPRKRPGLTAPAAPKVVVDPGRCLEFADACGEATYVGGGRLWWITTDNDRGDFFHEVRQLYDATDKTFWNPATDARHPDPAESADEFAKIHVSPDGTWGLFGDAILSLDRAEKTGTFVGSFCGWE